VARFDIYSNPYAAERVHTPFLVDVQNDHLGPLDSRVVIPLRSLRVMPKPAHRLNPLLEVAGKQWVLDTASLAPVLASLLRKPVGRAEAAKADVFDALDTLFGSY